MLATITVLVLPPSESCAMPSHTCARHPPHLQQPGQLGVAVWHVRPLAVCQGADHVAQRRQRQVDFGGLLEPLPGRARLALPLAAGQIDQIELAHAHVALIALLHVSL